MTWEEKFAAICALVPEASLRMRAPGNWYVTTAGVEIGGDGLLRGPCSDGKTPQLAVEQCWSALTMIPSDRYLVTKAMGPARRHVRWNGFMWSVEPAEETR